MEDPNDIGAEIAKEISHTIARRIAMGIAFFFGFLLFIAVGGAAVLLLWNWLMPDIFRLRPLTFWEALGLLALCRILFGGFGRGGHAHSERPSRRGPHKAWWKAPRPPASPPTPPSSSGPESLAAHRP